MHRRQFLKHAIAGSAAVAALGPSAKSWAEPDRGSLGFITSRRLGDK